MNIFTGVESNELFGGEVSPHVTHLIDVARNAPRDQVEAALWTAAVTSPQSLPVYYLLYKFHAGQGQFDAALRAAEAGLAAAARAAGLAERWWRVTPGDADFSQPGPSRFWLFTLKAKAFIHLRRGESGQAELLLVKLRQLDPADQVGFGVIEALLRQAG